MGCTACICLFFYIKTNNRLLVDASVETGGQLYNDTSHIEVCEYSMDKMRFSTFSRIVLYFLSNGWILTGVLWCEVTTLPSVPVQNCFAARTPFIQTLRHPCAHIIRSIHESHMIVYLSFPPRHTVTPIHRYTISLSHTQQLLYSLGRHRNTFSKT